VQEQYVVTGNSYKIESTTTALVYMPCSCAYINQYWQLTKQGLKPEHFELHQGDNPKKALFADLMAK